VAREASQAASAAAAPVLQTAIASRTAQGNAAAQSCSSTTKVHFKQGLQNKCWLEWIATTLAGLRSHSVLCHKGPKHPELLDSCAHGTPEAEDQQ